MKLKLPALLSALAFTLLASPPRLGAQTLNPTFTVLHAFPGGGANGAELVQRADGNFFGIARGGKYDRGTVFKMGPAGGVTPLHDFTGDSDGAFPSGALVQGSDGNFYGAADVGGANGAGTIFQITPTGALTTVYNFSAYDANYRNGDGTNPSTVIFDRDGNLYGTTVNGGANGTGTVFRVTTAGVFTTLHSFAAVNADGTNSDGTSAYGALVQGSDGDFYGMTMFGGSNVSTDYRNYACGTIFKITPAGDLTTLYNFTTRDGEFPYGALVEGRDGNFYGTTSQGGGATYGAIFRITPSGIFTKLHAFGANSGDGLEPYAGLIQASDGNFYGTTREGGTAGAGTVFQMTPAGVVTTVHDFKNYYTEGYYLYDPVIEGINGDLYGSTIYGGPGGAGTIFRLDLFSFVEQFTASTYQAAETADTVTLHVARTAGDARAASVRYATADATATAGRDYANTSGKLVWAEGDTSVKSIVVKLLNPGPEYPNARRRFTVSLSAPNGVGSIGATGTATVVLLGTTPRPVITSPTTAGGAVGAAFSYQITATRNPSRYGVLGLPKGLSIDARTGLISGILPGAGTHTLTLQAFNQGGEGTAPLTLTTTLQAPVITSADTAVGAVNEAFAYQITATGHPGRYGVLGLPKGLTVDDRTGLISGTPQGVGTHELTLHAFNSQGEGIQTLTLTVSKQPPVITSSTTATATAGQPFSYQITAEGDPTQFHVLGLPLGLSVNAATGLISGTPAHGGEYQLTLKAVNGTGTGMETLTLTISN